jgi:hypothetical protein
MDEEARLQLMSIIDRIPPGERRTIAELSEERVILLHHGLGMFIRNMIRSGELGALFRWSCAQAPGEPRSLDSLAWPILLEVWKVLRAS